jgi:hypothetical protein
MICLWTLGSKASRCPELLLDGTVPRASSVLLLSPETKDKVLVAGLSVA